MSKRAYLTGLFILSIAVVIAFRVCAPVRQAPIIDNIEYKHTIDSLQKEVNEAKAVQDSLYLVINKSGTQVDSIDRWYEKELINITNQSIASDVLFFSEYISKTGK